jgi:hypothetical protein
VAALGVGCQARLPKGRAGFSRDGDDRSQLTFSEQWELYHQRGNSRPQDVTFLIERAGVMIELHDGQEALGVKIDLQPLQFLGDKS